MRTFFTIMIGIYLVLVSILAYPTVIEIMDEGEDNSHKVLEGAAVNEQWEFTKDVAELILYADQLGFKLTFGEAWRHVHQQAYYVRNGFSTTMNSKHRKRRAVDFNLFIDDNYKTKVEDYELLGQYWEGLDEKNTWGGSWKSFKDAPHFQRD